MHKLHLFVAAEYGCALLIISHDKWNSVFLSLSFQMNSFKLVVLSKPDTTSIHRALDLTTKKKATTLSEFIWKLKESKTEFHLSWDIIERAQPYAAATNRCNLCIAEKYFILKTKPSLNKRREIFSSYPHRKKHLYFTTKLPVARKQKTNNNTRSERQPNTPQSYPKRAEDKQHLCPPLETPVSYEENLR